MFDSLIKSFDHFIRRFLYMPFLTKTPQKTVFSKIIEASKKNDLQYLKLALAQENPSFDVPDETGSTAIFYAFEHGFIPILEFLMKQKVNINQSNIFGRTPIFSAVDSNNPEMLKFALEHGAIVTALDSNQHSVLHHALMNKKEGVIFYLLENENIQINQQNNFGKTALCMAAEMGLISQVKNLLAKGAVLDAPDNDGWTPLMFASSKGPDELVSLLLSAGADLHRKDKQFDQTAYLIAIRNNQVTTASILKRSNANVHDRDYYNRTALHIAVETNSFEMVEFVLSTGIDLEARDKFNLTAKEWAIVNSSSDILRAIMHANHQ